MTLASLQAANHTSPAASPSAAVTVSTTAALPAHALAASPPGIAVEPEPISLFPHILICENALRLDSRPWRGTGVSVPLFALRSNTGMGVGEFADLPLFIDWIADAGFNLLHILPVQDTYVRGHPNETSPYRAISVFALHPLYLSVRAVADTMVQQHGATLDREIIERISNTALQMKASEYVPPAVTGSAGSSSTGYPGHRPAASSTGSSSLSVADGLPPRPPMDYEAVMRTKLSLLRDLYRIGGAATLASEGFSRFFASNRAWLQPYALYCFFRDLLGVADPSAWGARTHITQVQVQALTDPSQLHYSSIAFYYFTQYHLHLQLQAAAEHAERRGVVLQTDIPVGCARGSCDVWTHPHLFKTDKAMSAPADPFQKEGQQFGFPPYCWDAMAKDGFTWWNRRMAHLGQYFNSVVLSSGVDYFRSYETPNTATTGLMGVFEPSLPLTCRDLRAAGLLTSSTRTSVAATSAISSGSNGIIKRLTSPWIREWTVRAALGGSSDRFSELVPRLFHVREGGVYLFKQHANTEAKLTELLSGTHHEDVLAPLLHLLSNVCFIRVKQTAAQVADLGAEEQEEAEDDDDEDEDEVSLTAHLASSTNTTRSISVYHPRVGMTDTTSFIELDEHTRQLARRLHRTYFQDRQSPLWRNAGMTRLSALQQCFGDAGKMAARESQHQHQPGMLWTSGFAPSNEMWEALRSLGIPPCLLQRLPTSAAPGASATGGSSKGGSGGNATVMLADPSQYEYCSVTMAGSADTPSLRSWWESDPALTAHYAHTQLKLGAANSDTSNGNGAVAQDSVVPRTCTPEIVQLILQQHLSSPSVWAVFPLVDVLGLDASLRCSAPHSERTNIPSVPHHYWRTRLHLTTEELMGPAGMRLAARIRGMIQAAGRAVAPLRSEERR
jgi:4-alpha-glucanotransferase